VGDPLADAIRRSAAGIGIALTGVQTAKVYLIEASLSQSQWDRLSASLLADPILEQCLQGAAPAPAGQVIEVHPLPGVMDPAALTVERMVRELTRAKEVRATTGVRYDLAGVSESQARDIARRLLANSVIESTHHEPWRPERFPIAARADQTLRSVAITALSEKELVTLSRSGHLFLSLDEMKAIQAHYRALGREPTDIELETLAQTWSEHCVHKTLKSTITYRGALASDIISWTARPGHVLNADGSVTIHNLLKSTVAAATHELIAEGVDWTLSVFVDNAGIIAFDEQTAVCVKVETHNHPSAIEPYGGAATGVGGCIRDIMGTGLGARPIANTDVFCVATPDIAVVPAGCLHPRRVLTRVVDGVRDYGNRMGIPTLNGAVYFDDRYVGNPLVFCGCVGVMPRDKIAGAAKDGDRIVALGGRTGRDGIHGATFSSAELEHGHADEFSHAVQIGNAIEEKRTLDAILRARDHASGCLYSAITDCGAGGFSSAVGEMGERLGAVVDLDKAPLKYEGLRYDEIWISESQERMVLAVPERNLGLLRAICDEEGVEMADLGRFGAPGRELVLRYAGTEVGRISMEFLHDGIPMPTREAIWEQTPSNRAAPISAAPDAREKLLSLLADPNIASKRWIVRQYDHEVQGATIIKPLVGPGGVGPGDASVIQPVPGSQRGLAIGCGLAVPVGDPEKGGDPYLMALAAVDECVRNLVCVGADPQRIAILDNFCWPSCEKPRNLASLVRAAEGCYDAAKAYRTPFVSGKDSLNNQFKTQDGRVIEIPPTLLITGIGIVPDVSRCVTMDLKCSAQTGETSLYLVAPQDSKTFDPAVGAKVARAVAELIRTGSILAAHDGSEGGMLVAIAEMLIAAQPRAAAIELDPQSPEIFFGEAASQYILELPRAAESSLAQALAAAGVDHRRVALARPCAPSEAGIRITRDKFVSQRELSTAFHATLDW
jgi:phosphoribosylformylglycinamidine synthase